MTRDESQTEVKNLFKYEYKGVGVCELCTGYGKTRIALDLAEDLNNIRKSKKLPEAHITVVVPSIILKTQWEKLAVKRNLRNLRVYVINSYVKSEKITTDFLIIDEIHRVTNDESNYFNKAIDITNYKYFLGLSGTLEDKHKSFLKERNIPIIKTITREEALLNGWVSNYVIYTIMCNLNDTDNREIKSLNNKIKSGFSYFNGKDTFNLILRVVSDKEFRKNIATTRGIEESKLFVICKQALDAIKRRKDILYNCDTKEELILEIVSKFKLKTIIFGQSTSFSDRIANAINKEKNNEIFLSVHSKKKAKENKESLRKLADNRYRIRGVCSAKSLSEGLDIPDLQLGVLPSYTSSKTIYSQQIGRITRLFKDKRAIMINICVEGSQDEKWLESNGGLENSIIVNSVDEIIEYENRCKIIIE